MPLPENSFILTHTVKNVAELTKDYGPIETHFDIPWKLKAEQNNDNLALFLLCSFENCSNMWSVSAAFNFKLKSKAGEEIEEGDEDPSKYTRDLTSWGYCEVIKWPRLVEEFVVDNQLTFECHVTIKDIVGISRKRKMDWEAPEERMTDLVMVVGKEKTKFHVHRVVLATFSPVFKAMFANPQYRESSDKECFSKIHVSDKNVEQVLVVADRYDVNAMTKKCEKHLMKKSKLRMEKKLKLAESYQLVNLHDHCLMSLKTAKQIADVCKNIADMGELTSKALLQKMADIARNPSPPIKLAQCVKQ
ncbi:unnamed protein product [Caenorhabditis sp. 36 PRJEB53466]|nr:unnamed protein product [Caenorhabditis sp. 36 PRJEB53466]